MRRFLLDSAPLAAYLHGRPLAKQLIAPWLSRQAAATSVLCYGEVVEYLKGLPDFSRRRADLRRLLRVVAPFFLSYPTLDRYADIRRRLRPPHGPGLIGDVDTLIAATALEHNLTVVTVDSDFLRVPHLKVQLVSLR